MWLIANRVVYFCCRFVCCLISCLDFKGFVSNFADILLLAIARLKQRGTPSTCTMKQTVDYPLNNRDQHFHSYSRRFGVAFNPHTANHSSLSCCALGGPAE